MNNKLGLITMCAKAGRLSLGMDMAKDACRSGALKEAWGCGTAAVVSPIGHLMMDDEVFTINNNEIGTVTQHLYDTLTGIQWGRIADTRGWIHKI